MSKPTENPAIKTAWEHSEEFYKEILSHPKKALYIHDGQPGVGKTYSLLKIISKTGTSVAFFSANHSHLKKVKDILEKFGIDDTQYIHGMGFEKSCSRYPPSTKSKKSYTPDQRYIHRIHTTLGPRFSTLLCDSCPEKTTCLYYEYKTNSKNYSVTLQPLEYLHSNRNKEKDIFVIDEAISKYEYLHWDFDLTRIHNLNKVIKILTSGTTDYIDIFYQIHRALLQHTSLIFTEKPNILFKMNYDTFSSDEYRNNGYIQEKNIITHPASIVLDTHLPDDIQDIIYDILRTGKDNELTEQIGALIHKAIIKKDKKKLEELMEYYIPFEQWFRFLRILLFKQPGDKSALILSEKIEHKKRIDFEIKHQEIVKHNQKFEWGFINDHPYIRDKLVGDYVISHMGTRYEKEGKTWFTIGHPYLFRVFDLSLQKPVILLDATYNPRLFKELLFQWLRYHTSEIIVDNPYISFEEKLRTVSSKYRKNLKLIKPLSIENMFSTVYDVEGAFSLDSINSGKLKQIIGLIATVDKKSSKKIATICKKVLVQVIKKEFPTVKALYHFNQRGKDLEEDILFVIGTPYLRSETYIHEHILMFNSLPITIERKKPEKPMRGFIDPLLNTIFQIHVLDEIYHGLHRTRILRYNCEVYALCLLPEKIRNEAMDIRIKNINELSYDPIWNLLDLVTKNEGESLTFFYGKIKIREKYKAIGGWKKLKRRAIDEGFIELKIVKTKTRPKTVIYSTKKGRSFHKKFRKYFAK